MASSIEGNKSIGKLLRVLEAFISASGPLSLFRLCELTGLSRASLYRILNPMLEQGFLRHDPAAKLYAPGAKLYHLGLSALRAQDAGHLLAEHLEKLHHAAQHTVVLAELTGGHILYTHKYERSEGLKISLILGVPHPAGHGVLGRLILAFQKEEEARRLLETEPPLSWLRGPWPGWAAARPLLREIKEQGFAADRGEHDHSTSVVGVPVIDQQGQVRSAVGVLVPSMLCTEVEVRRCLAPLRACAAEIARLPGARAQL